MIPRRPGDGVFPHFYRPVADVARELACGILSVLFGVRRLGVHGYDVRTTPGGVVARKHLLGPNVLLIGGSAATFDELRLLADTGTPLAHSPVANMKMATGIFPLPDALTAGVRVALGTDGGLNNNVHDMFAEMKSSILLHNAVRRRATTISPQTMLELATLGGAQAIGRAHELGSLEPGKFADIVLVDLKRAHTQPVHDIVSNLVFAANGSNVDTVLVGGRIVLRGGALVGADESTMLIAVANAGERIRAMLGLRRPGAWPIEGWAVLTRDSLI